MNSSLRTLHLLKQLWSHISQRRRRQFLFLIGLTLLSSFAEMMSLSSVIPFIGVLTQPEKVFNLPIVGRAVRGLGIDSAADLVVPLTLTFASAALIAGGLRLILLWVSIRLSNAAGADLGIEVFQRTLYQPYSVHVERSSSEIISGITQKVGTATGILMSVVTVAISAMLFISIMMTLLVIDPMVAIFAAIAFGSAYGVIAWQTRHRLVRNSQRIAHEQTQVVKALQEGLGGIRDVLLDGAQTVYSNVYRKAVMQLQLASSENSFINQAPRFAMESLGMVLIAIFVLVLSYRSGGVGAALPVLGMLALGAQRLLPIMQQLYGNWSVLVGNKAALIDVINLLSQPLPENISQPEPKPLDFNDDIRFEDVHFHYGRSGPLVLHGINITIPKGSKIGVIGATGSGKSTFLDLLMGLLEPTKGKILVDRRHINNVCQRAWQRNIAHVPQNIFLTDTTIAENIAFGVSPDQIDFTRMKKAAEQAQIAEFIESREGGYNSIVGERGVRLSGGQRQRIGIARALYKNATVLVFDEATSALDNNTEESVMRAIEELDEDLTVIIIAHRLSTLKNCEQIIELCAGGIKKIGTYQNIVEHSM